MPLKEWFMDTVTDHNSKRDPMTELNSAAQLYWIFSFLLGLPFAIAIALSNAKFSASGLEFCFVFVSFIMLMVLAGILLFMRIRFGLYLSWILLPLILIAFPIGTAFGVFIISKLVKPDVRKLLTK